MLLLLATTEWTGSVARNPHLKRTCLHGNSFLSGDQPITMLNLVSAFYSEVRLCSRCVQIKLPSVNDQMSPPLVLLDLARPSPLQSPEQ